MTIILGGDSLNKTFFLKEQDAIYLFFFHQSRFIFRAAAMSRATILLRNGYFLKKYIEIIFLIFFLYYHIKIIPKHQKILI